MSKDIITRHFTPAEIATRFNCLPAKVRDWIKTGQLSAINAATDPRGKKPRWQITAESLEAFERSRSSKPATSRTARPRKRDTTGVIEFFK
jgi:hypothetical protein